jgi:uncharacterized membrane protein YgaE (UPF0421/DUF939 family)
MGTPAPAPDRTGSAEQMRAAARRGAGGLRAGGLRLRARTWPIMQSAVAAAGAWEIAVEVLGHRRPFFAPVAAIIALGVTFGQRTRRAVELIVGVAVGLVVADLLVLVTGTGTVPLGIVVGLAMAAAVFLDGGPVLVAQAAVSAVLVATVDPPTRGLSPDRLVDALTGGTLALLINALFFPLDPLKLVVRAVQPVISALGEALERMATALAGGDLRGAERALLAARDTDEQLAYLREAVAVARETARVAPPRRGARLEVERWAQVAAQLDLAVRDARVLGRATIRALGEGEPAPGGLADAVRELARAVWGLGVQLDRPEEAGETRRLAVGAAALATAVLDEHRDMATSAVVAQVRSTAVDLLRASGLDRAEARAALGRPAG